MIAVDGIAALVGPIVVVAFFRRLREGLPRRACGSLWQPYFPLRKFCAV
jgi:hypothetical protein